VGVGAGPAPRATGLRSGAPREISLAGPAGGCGEIGDPLHFEFVADEFRRLVTEAGLPRITLHGMRHSFATIALHEGVDVLYVAEVLGHSSPNITQSIYQHTRPERKAEAVNRVGAAIFG
jgi:hypothetical protein